MMRIRNAVWTVIVAVAVASGISCTNGSTAERAGSAAMPRLAGSGAGAGGTAAPSIPPGAQWTVFCQEYTSPDHVLQAKRIREMLVDATHMKDWYVVHHEDRSTLYYGFYKSINKADDRAEAARAQQGLQMVKTLSDTNQERPFAGALLVSLELADPPAPPEWNLANAPGWAYWSLQIAAYEGSPQRKQAAVDSVRAARAQGIPAYFHHGDSISEVCIGLWPRQAVKEQEAATAGTTDPEQRLLVLPFPVPGLPKLYDHNGKPVKVMAPEADVVDPSLLQAMKQYPDMAVNGEVRMSVLRDPVTGKTTQVPEPSYLVPVPHRQPSLLDGTIAGRTAPPPGVELPPPPVIPVGARAPAAPLPGEGHLRSIGE